MTLTILWTLIIVWAIGVYKFFIVTGDWHQVVFGYVGTGLLCVLVGYTTWAAFIFSNILAVVLISTVAVVDRLIIFIKSRGN